MLLMQLGLTREVVILQEKITTFTQLLLNPPVPSFLRAALPKRAIAAVEDAGFRREGPFVIAFMKSGCPGCLALAKGLKEAVSEGWIAANAITCFLLEGSAGSQVDDVIRDTTPFVAEATLRGTFLACEVAGTPAMLAVDPQTWNVFGHTVGGDAAWAVSRLQMGPQRALLPTLPTRGSPVTDHQASS